ncbi:hypothetical protein ACJQWK_10695 [Exserohilum turcicum]
MKLASARPPTFIHIRGTVDIRGITQPAHVHALYVNRTPRLPWHIIQDSRFPTAVTQGLPIYVKHFVLATVLHVLGPDRNMCELHALPLVTMLLQRHNTSPCHNTIQKGNRWARFQALNSSFLGSMFYHCLCSNPSPLSHAGPVGRHGTLSHTLATRYTICE